MLLFRVAKTVGRPVYELEVEMPLMELLEWRAFFEMEAEAEEKAAEKTKRELKRGSKRSR